MKRIALFLLALVAMTSALQAQLLWKVTGNGLKSPSYIFGTHHVAPISILDSIAGFNQALESVDRVYGEIDMSQMTDMATQMKMAAHMQAPADSTLSKVLTADEIAMLDAALQKAGAPLNAAALEPMKPAAVANVLTMFLTTQAFPDFDQSRQLDMTIQAMGRENGKQVGGLETLDDQIRILFDTPISEQAEGLVKSIKDIDKTIAMAHTMSTVYLAGNLDGLLKMMRDPDTGMTDEEADILINNRNSSWVEFLLGILPTASVMVVVGAGHLPGEKGVISLLRKAGYEVEPM